MLSPKPQYSIKNARMYFREHLQVGDYYMEGQHIQGEWFGQGAEKLGLKGAVSEEAFIALCEGNDPNSGMFLTQRKNHVRLVNGQEKSNRRLYYDFVLSPPKSVSIVALYKDERIVELHNQAISRAMQELEKHAGTRVRKDGQNSERLTGNIIGATFQHDTSRELDPHLHTHCLIFNATYDPVEERWKALETHEMYKAQLFIRNYYFHELSKGLKRMFYGIENNAGAFEISGVSKELIATFSKRHQQIDEETRRRIETEGLRGNENDLREQVAYESRRRKIKNATAALLRGHWRNQMTVDQREALNDLLRAQPYEERNEHVAEVIEWTKGHLFERHSVVTEHQFLASALERARGRNMDLDGLKKAMADANLERDIDGRRITSSVVLDRELEVVLAAKDGRDGYRPFNPTYQSAIKTISDEQSQALNHILSSHDFITLFRGKAGAGKSFVLKEVQQGLKESGHYVVFLTPQRGQVLEFRRNGVEATTVALFLIKKEMQVNGVVVVDEAGQVGGKQMYDLVNIVREREGRIILSGDTGQHGAVTASDALRAIEKYSLLEAAELREIRRQSPELGKCRKERQAIAGYREAVRKASDGRIVASYAQLERLKRIKELDPFKRHEVLARDYLKTVESKESTLIVAQTWDEIEGVNEAVRQSLKEQNRLGEGRELRTYQSLDLSEAEKRDSRYYSQGDFAYFIKRYGRYHKGDICPVIKTGDKGITLEKNGRQSTMSYRYIDRIVAVRERLMEVAVGDRIQVKFNGESREGLHVTNGELVSVKRIMKNGSLVVRDDGGKTKTLTPDQRLLNRGYAVTSYASQGKTVDHVLFSDSASKLATSKKQWYVAISRGRKSVTVYTSDREGLRKNIQRTGDRELAMELETKAKAARMERERLLPKVYHGLSAVQQQIMLNIQNMIHREAIGENTVEPGVTEKFTPVEELAPSIEQMEGFNPAIQQPMNHEHHMGVEL